MTRLILLSAIALQKRITIMLPCENLYRPINEQKRAVQGPWHCALTKAVPLRSITKGSFD
jgi:hypothetical protein